MILIEFRQFFIGFSKMNFTHRYVVKVTKRRAANDKPSRGHGGRDFLPERNKECC